MTKVTGISRSPIDLADAGEGRTGGHEAATRKLSAATGGFIIALPMPPSVNSFEHDRRGRPLGNRSSKVKVWQMQCDAVLMSCRPRPVKVAGPVAITAQWDTRYWGLRDLDNPLKPLLDWLQRVELIDNDRSCWRLFVGFGTAPEGCLVQVKPAGVLP